MATLLYTYDSMCARGGTSPWQSPNWNMVIAKKSRHPTKDGKVNPDTYLPD